MVSSVAGALGTNVQASFGRLVVALSLRSAVGLAPILGLCWTHFGAQNLHLGAHVGDVFWSTGGSGSASGPILGTFLSTLSSRSASWRWGSHLGPFMYNFWANLGSI